MFSTILPPFESYFFPTEARFRVVQLLLIPLSFILLYCFFLTTTLLLVNWTPYILFPFVVSIGVLIIRHIRARSHEIIRARTIIPFIIFTFPCNITMTTNQVVFRRFEWCDDHTCDVKQFIRPIAHSTASTRYTYAHEQVLQRSGGIPRRTGTHTPSQVMMKG